MRRFVAKSSAPNPYTLAQSLGKLRVLICSAYPEASNEAVAETLDPLLVMLQLQEPVAEGRTYFGVSDVGCGGVLGGSAVRR